MSSALGFDVIKRHAGELGVVRYAMMALLLSLAVVLAGAVLLVIGLDEAGAFGPKAVAGFIMIAVGSVAGAAFNMRVLFPKHQRKYKNDYEADD